MWLVEASYSYCSGNIKALFESPLPISTQSQADTLLSWKDMATANLQPRFAYLWQCDIFSSVI